MATAVDHALRLRSLWIAWLLAMLFHVELGLMPLFHGISPEIHGHVAAARLPLLFGAMLAYVLVPDARADQIVLMLAMELIGLLINREALFWWRDQRGPLSPSRQATWATLADARPSRS
ncbi:MAG: hypothetical protein FJ082_02740 [Cyanobacteria bacterium K_Offshore_surface_m2_011]|nr:hypothetical protein [Cyanobacteria bacterium K_Offshore_surface_m2_011]